MDNYQVDALYRILIGVGCGIAVVSLLALGPLILYGSLIATGIVGARWWRRIGRFKNLQMADRKGFFEITDFIGGLFDFEINGVHHHMLYLGNSKDGTIRYWYDEGYYYPQAVDDGTMYWEQRVHIDNPELRQKLNGFQEMGNEWPAYYQEVVLAEQRKKKRKEVQEKKKKEATGAATAASAFLNDHPNYVMDLQETVEELRKEIEGYCPTIDFDGMKQ